VGGTPLAIGTLCRPRFIEQARSMIAVCGAGTALSAAQPPQTTIMDGILDGRDVVSIKHY